MASRKDTPVTSVEAGLDYLRTFNGTGIYYGAMLMQAEDDSYFICEYNSQPCYGFIRTYGKNSNRPNDRKPGDLPSGFPDGTPLAVVLPVSATIEASVFEEWFDPKISPYRSLFKPGTYEVLYAKPGRDYVRAILFTDTSELKSTLMINFFKFFGRGSPLLVYKTLLADPKAKDYTKQDIMVATMLTYNSYHGTAEVKRLYDGNPYDLDGGLTFKQRAAYNRPQVEVIFGKSVPLANVYNVSLETRMEHIKKFISETDQTVTLLP